MQVGGRKTERVMAGWKGTPGRRELGRAVQGAREAFLLGLVGRPEGAYSTYHEALRECSLHSHYLCGLSVAHTLICMCLFGHM